MLLRIEQEGYDINEGWEETVENENGEAHDGL